MGIRLYQVFLVAGVIGMLVDTWSLILSGLFALILLVLVIYNLIYSLGSTSAGTRALISFLAVLQLLAAPWLFYKNFDQTQLSALFQINMLVSYDEYFDVMISAVSFFCAGVLATNTQSVGRAPLPSQKIAKTVFSLGLAATLIQRFDLIGSYSSGFLWYILTLLLPSGILMLHALKLKKFPQLKLHRSYPFWGFLLWLLIEASGSGMFGNLVFWGFMGVVITLQQRPVGIPGRIGLIFIALLAVGVLQAAKSIYRSQAWTGGNSGVQVLIESFGEAISRTTEGSSEVEQIHTIFRLNQGWHLSHVMKRCEDEDILLLGQKAFESIFASFIPRVIWPSKPEAGGHDNIEKYTYINLNKATSMNISFFGDLYVDFGSRGLALAVLIFGLILSYTFQIIDNFAQSSAFIAATFPIVLVGMLQIETDMMMVTNHGAKSFFLLWFLSGFFDQERSLGNSSKWKSI